MRRPPMIAILTVGACALGAAAPAAAQTPAPQAAPSSAGAAGLRYLTWPGRTYRPAPVAAPGVAAGTLSRPPVIPRGGQSMPVPEVAPSAEPPRQGLTPASAWVSLQAPAYQPRPAASAEASTARPYYAAAPMAAPAPAQPASQAAASPSSQTRAAAPAPTPSTYFAETAEATPPPPPPAPPAVESTPVNAHDPMAPRRDALIFTLQRPAAAPAVGAPVAQPQADAAPAPLAAETPASQGSARYYSVHRQAGRQPDATPLPAPVYLDALPVDLTTTPASPDLAEPPAAPNLIRNANGRLQALPANEDPTLP